MTHLFGYLLRLPFVESVMSIVIHMRLKSVKVPEEFAIDEWTEDMVEECNDLLVDTQQITGWDYELLRREVYLAITQIRISASTASMKIAAKKKFGINDEENSNK